MREHPIIYSTEMVKAYLEDRKTMTRRVMKPQPVFQNSRLSILTEPHNVYVWRARKDTEWYAWDNWDFKFDPCIGNDCPYGQPGDRLWVRECFWLLESLLLSTANLIAEGHPALYYQADMNEHEQRKGGWLRGWYNKYPSIYMPRWASRLTQTITSIRVERLQNMTEEDAIKEGMTVESDNFDAPPAMKFAITWDSINAKRGYSWASNPWVWVIEFPKYSEECANLKQGK